MKKFFKKRKTALMLITTLLIMLVSIISPLNASKAQAKSWLAGNEKYENMYSDAAVTFAPEIGNSSYESTDDETWVMRLIGGVANAIGHLFTNLIGASSNNRTINFSLEGIVYGQLAQGMPSGSANDYFSFRLDKGNVYGIVGAAIYAVTRSICMSALFIMFLFALARGLFLTNPRAREEMKSTIYGTLLGVALMILLPNLIEMIIFIRDAAMWTITQRLGFGQRTIFDFINAGYNNGDKFLFGTMYLALAIGILYYAKDYITIAMQQTVLFAMFPVFNVAGAGKKKYLSDWATTFVTNLLVPFIDAVILMIPFMTAEVISATGKNEIKKIGGLVTIIMIWGCRATRAQIVKLAGNALGAPTSGLPGLSQIARNAAKSMQSTIGSIARNGSGNRAAEETYGEASSKEIGARKEGSIFANEAKSIDTEGLRSVNDIMNGEEGTSESDKIREELNAMTESRVDEKGKEYDLEPEDMIDNENKWDDIRSGNLEQMEAAQDKMDELEAENRNLSNLSDDEILSQMESESGDHPSINDLQEQIDDIDKAIAHENVLGAENTRDTDNAIFAEKEAMEAGAHSKQIVEEEMAGLKKSGNMPLAGREEFLNEIKEKGQEKINNAQNSIATLQKNASVFRDENRSTTAELNERRVKLQKQMEGLHRQADEERDRRMRGNSEKAEALKRQIETRKKLEKQFANVAESHGMDARTYTSKKEFETARNIRRNKQEQAINNLKRNHSMAKDLKDLSPAARQQLAEIQKKQILASNIKKYAASTVKTVALTSAGAVGTVAGAYTFAMGGEDDTVYGGVLGSSGSRAMVGNAANLAEGITSAAVRRYRRHRDVDSNKPTPTPKPESKNQSTNKKTNAVPLKKSTEVNKPDDSVFNQIVNDARNGIGK